MALNEQIALEEQRQRQLQLEANELKKAEELRQAREKLAYLKEQNEAAKRAYDSRLAALNKPAGEEATPSTSRGMDSGIINQVLLNQHAISKDLENNQLRLHTMR
jgi:hypothetical protein